MTATGRAVVGAAGVAVLWLLLAIGRPGATYHLAPALVVWAAPYLHGLRDHSRRKRRVAVLIGAAVALATTGLLAWLGRLDGPWLAGGGAIEETLLVTGAGTAAALAVATLAPVAPPASRDV